MDAQTARILVIVLYYVAAYIITGVVTAVLVALAFFPIANKYARFPLESRPLGIIVGIVERILYTTSVIIGKPEFVGV